MESKRQVEKKLATSLGRSEATFSPGMEQELFERIKTLDDMFCGPTTKYRCVLAFEFAQKQNISRDPIQLDGWHEDVPNTTCWNNSPICLW